MTEKIKVPPNQLKNILKNKQCKTPYGEYIARELGHPNSCLATINDDDFSLSLLFKYIEFIDDTINNKSNC